MQKKLANRLAAQPSEFFRKLYISFIEDSHKDYIINQVVFKEVISVLNSYEKLELFEQHYLEKNLSEDHLAIISFYSQLKDCYNYVLSKINSCSDNCQDDNCVIIYFQNFIAQYGIELFELSFWNYNQMPNSRFSKELHGLINLIKRY